MKMKSITIQGMHKVVNQTYSLSDLTYFVGPNGAGKSTIMQAIQLAILGYIPGYPKTNEGVMRHANGLALAVNLEFDDGSYINRSYVRAGSSVKATVGASDPSLTEEGALLGQIELPLFNFNDFKGLTANKLKEWFINFLPGVDAEIDWATELSECIKDRQLNVDDELDTAVNAIKHMYHPDAQVSAIDRVKAANEYFKEEQSFVKGEIASNQSAINALIYHEDAADLDKDELKAEYNKLLNIKTEAAKIDANRKHKESIEMQINQLLAGAPIEAFEAKIAELKEKVGEELSEPVYEEIPSELTYSLKEATETEAILRDELATIRANITSDVCPYTKQKCESIANTVDKLKEKYANVEKRLQIVVECKEKRTSEIDEIKARNFGIQAEYNKAVTDKKLAQSALAAVESKYNQIQMLQDELAKLGSDEVIYDLNEIDARLKSINSDLAKIAANEQYSQVIDKLTSDKFKLENYAEALKLWVKRTDANGLQNELAQKPFAQLADSMTKFIQLLFNDDSIKCNFNLSSKANSFSFGIVKDSTYIEYDLLSSGEKCLYMIAMLMCLTAESDARLKVMLLDDVLDHLDDENAERLFKGLEKSDDIQIIMAGVKACDIEKICTVIK